MAAAEARSPEAEALIEMILKLAVSGGHGRREMEPVFRAEPPRPRRRWRLVRRPAPEVRTGWRIGCYYHLETLQVGYRFRRELAHPVYLLSDGRLVVAAFRVVDTEGAVAELDRQRSRAPSWFTPLDDSSSFFAVLPGHYLGELKALYDDLAGTAQ